MKKWLSRWIFDEEFMFKEKDPPKEEELEDAKVSPFGLDDGKKAKK